jgi:hypothetical protein
MKRKRRYNEIKRVRKLRDECLIENNTGRKRHLISRMPGFYQFSTQGLHNNLIMENGYDYCVNAVFGENEIMMKAYFHWMKYILTQTNTKSDSKEINFTVKYHSKTYETNYIKTLKNTIKRLNIELAQIKKR